MLFATLLTFALPQEPTPPPQVLHFSRQSLSAKFLCEGAAFGDLTGDGKPDLVAGPWWYEGPDFQVRHPLYPEKQFHRLHYSDHFFAWIHDLDLDGRNDVFVVTFPGEKAYWLRNTGQKDLWTRYDVCDGVDNESPLFADVTGDGRPELVCQNQDRLGWFEADWREPQRPWQFHAVLAKGAGPKFTHGLGAGDLNGDGRVDILRKEGWYEHPAAADGAWTFHPVPFSPSYGGAQMLVTDVDGDGDQDVVTALEAHGYGLYWFEQQPGGAFVPHEILSAVPGRGNTSELHALCLCDLDGDGLLDVVTGKRWWSHGPSKAQNRDGADDPAWLLGLLLRRDPTGARYQVTLLDADSGVGTQVAAGDVDGDGRADVVVANKRGTFVLRQQPGPAQGVLPDLGFESGTLRGWTATGTAFTGQPIRGDTVVERKPKLKSGHRGEYWIGGYEVLEDAPQGTLLSEPFAVAKPWATFLVGGGRSETTRVEVLSGDGARVLCTATGNDDETMQPVLVDLGEHLGKTIRIRLVDESSAGWGHLNFDDFQFHDQPVRGNLPNRTAGLTPNEAARAMTAAPGIAVDLIAGEPDLHQPVALWVDGRGRLWVAEAYSYPQRRKDGEAHDTILVFEDRDHDGSFETRTVFHDRLNLVSGLCVGFGGVWIGAAPELLFVPDRDGDLVPDGPPEVVLDGFGLQDTHETLNSFTWGPDGWLYGTHGVFTHSRVGKPGTPDAQRIGLNCGVWRLHPSRRDFEVFAFGTSNPWGVDFDDRGEAFLACCVIPHLWHMVQGGRFERQGGSHFDAHAWLEIQTIADHRHFAGNTRDHAWWGGRERPVADPGTDAAGGGHAHCGTLVYRGTAFPPSFRNAVLFCNIHGNRVNQDRVERRGSGYVGKHAPDPVRANDPWFRGVALRQGPAGEIFCIDWYDQNACHREKPELWDRSNGRLYRFRYGPLRGPAPAYDALPSEQLAALLASDDGFATDHARRVLQERGPASEAVRAVLLRLLRTHAEPLARLRALWGLHSTQSLDAALLGEVLSSEHEDLRAWAVRLAAEVPAAHPTVLAALPALAQRETAPAVRLALAAALQRLPVAQRWELAAALLGHDDSQDHNLPTVLWYAVEPLAAADPVRTAQLALGARCTKVRELLWRRLGVGGDAERAALLTALGSSAAPRSEILQQLLLAQKEQPGVAAPAGWDAVRPVLLADADAVVRDRTADLALGYGDRNLAPVFRAQLVDRTADPKRRLAALDGLVRLGDAATGPLLLGLLDEPALRQRALAGLAGYDLPEAPARLIQLLPQLEPTERELALQALTGRPGPAKAFLAAVAEGTLSHKLLDAVTLRRQLLALGDPAIEDLLQRAWGKSAPPSASVEAETARYKKLLTAEFLATADRCNGRAIFARTCQACHTLWDRGGNLGPDLTGSNRRDLDYLLSNLLDPSAEMGRDYQLVTLRLKDGRMVAGNLQKDTPAALHMKTLGGPLLIPRSELAADLPDQPAIDFQKVSLMPPGQLQSLGDGDARDLIAYLMGEGQAEVQASPENLGSFFDGRSLLGWDCDRKVWSVEDGELVGKAPLGLPHNSFARSELLLGDFRLELDVKLVPDTANSGLQFRSVALPNGEMRGYQADIGHGWWGLLYEEEGRGILQKAQANPVQPGAWNHYEILAVGDRVQLAINGVRTVDLVDPAGARRGVVGLQVHSGGPTEVRFRKFALELDPKPVLRSVR